jgi:drug/metabolite transporter (DMT)-like permease
MPRDFADRAALAAPALFVILWASGFVGAKFGLPYAEPLTFLSVRMATVVGLLGLLILVTRPVWPSRTAVLHSVVTGLMVHGLYLGGVFISIHEHLPAGLSALVVGLQPVFSSTIANRWLGERVTPTQWTGLLLGLGGVMLIVQGKTGGDTSALGWIAATVALFGITLGTLYQKRFGGGIDWRPGFFIQYASACALFFGGALLTETRQVQWTGEFLFAVGWLVLVLSFGGVWLLYYLIKHSAAARLASLFYLTPPTTALMAYWLFDEKLAPLALAGMAIAVVGVFLVNWGAARPT